MPPSNSSLRKCSLFRSRVVVVYVFPMDGAQHHGTWARRFVECYQKFPPGIDHDTCIVCNGAPRSRNADRIFLPLANVFFIEHDDSGWDIGAYQFAARTVPATLMVFFGGSTIFRRAGWLARMKQAYDQYGPAQYGAMGNRGNLAVGVWPHIRSTAFWMEPELLNSYPHLINRPELRHPFEHGGNCFTNWTTKCGFPSLVVTWNRVLEWKNWDDDPNGYQRGNQSGLLALDRMCLAPFYG